MKTKFLICACLMLISRLISYAGTYPQKVVINRDTLGLFTIAQIDSINETYVKWRTAMELNGSLRMTLNDARSELHACDHENALLIQSSALKDSIHVNDVKIIEKKDIQLNQATQHTGWLKTTRLIFFISTLVLTGMYFAK